MISRLQEQQAWRTVDVIIQSTNPTDAHHHESTEQGGKLKTKLDLIKAAHYSVPVDSLVCR